jgi:pullulanase/glycogen debranching enzyme
MKHNKKRNTAFLYESLVKELTKAVVRQQEAKKKTILGLIKESFSKGSPLNKDLSLYRSILENKDKMTKDFTDRFLVETKKDYNALDRKSVFNAQTKLISQINQQLGASVFNNFVPNYKDIATVGSWFQDTKSNAKSRLIIETKVKSLLVPSIEQEKEMKHIDNLTYKTFVNKFNDTYKNSLKENQKSLLTNYITSFSDNGLGLKSFINEELGSLKLQLSQKLSEGKDTIGEERHEKLSKVSVILEDFTKRPLDESMVKKLFFIQDLMGEI